MNCYFVETERFQEEQVKEALLNSQFDAFVPKKEMYFKKRDLTTLTLRFLFPGTVLIHDPASPPQFAKKLNAWLDQKHPDTEWIHRELEAYYSLLPDEKDDLEQLLDDEKILRFSKGIIRNKELHVLKGPLQGREKEVQKIKRHQRLATLPIKLCGQTILLIVGLEIVEKN